MLPLVPLDEYINKYPFKVWEAKENRPEENELNGNAEVNHPHKEVQSQIGPPSHYRLYEAVKKEEYKIAEELIHQGADADRVLYLFCQKKYFSPAGWLIAKSAKINELILSKMIVANNVNAVRFLIERKADPNGLDQCFLLDRSRKIHDGTSLHVAAAMGNREIVELLIESNADLMAKCNYFDPAFVNNRSINAINDTPFSIAKKLNHRLIVKILNEAGRSKKTTSFTYHFKKSLPFRVK